MFNDEKMAYEITGDTKIFGILADPIHHVKTPQRINNHFRKVGFDGILIPIHVLPASLPEVVNGLRHMENLGGIVVTVPHKSEILKLCDSASDMTRRIGAANVVRRHNDGTLIANMLDGKGFISGLLSAGHQVKGRHVYMAGAGGAANALAFELVDADVASLTIANRTTEKVDSLISRIRDSHPKTKIFRGTADPTGYDVVINTTSLGLRAEDALPLDTSKLDVTQLVCDIIMAPRETKLLQAAKEKGCRIHYGAPMLINQIELMAEFLGVTPGASTSIEQV